MLEERNYSKEMAMAREKLQHKLGAAATYPPAADEGDSPNLQSFPLRYMKQFFSQVRGAFKRDGGRDKECKAV
jgi:hypothetical protein